MPIRFACAQCDARVKTPDGSEGKKMKCPRCGHLQRVPEKGAAPPLEKTEKDQKTEKPADSPAPAPSPPTPPAKAQEPTPAPQQPPADQPQPTPAPPDSNAASPDEALGALAAAGAQQTASPADAEDEPPTQSPPGSSPQSPREPAGQAEQAAPPPFRPRPTPQPRANSGQATPEAPKAIPLSAHRPRPMPQPKPAGGEADASSGSALSAQVLSATPSAATPSAAAPETRGRSLDLSESELPRARTRRQIARIRAQLYVLIWLCRAIAVVIAAGAVELMLHAGRENASILTQAIFLVAGLAASGLAVAVGQIAAKLRQTLTGS